jgi:hypothetical protein
MIQVFSNGKGKGWTAYQNGDRLIGFMSLKAMERWLRAMGHTTWSIF